MSDAEREVQVNEPSDDKRVALALAQRLATLDASKQDELLVLFSRCVLHTQHPDWGLEEIRKRARGDNSSTM